MNNLNNKAQENLKLLSNLNENDNLISENGSLQLQDEYVQVENTNEIEYAIYLTFNQLLFSNDYKTIYQDDIFNKIDITIDNIFNNKQLNQLIENTNLRIIIDDIDEKLDFVKERYYYDSPFFSCFKNVYRLINHTKTIFNENNKFVSRMLHVSNQMLHEDIVFNDYDVDDYPLINDSTDDDDHNDSDSDNHCDSDNETVINEDKLD